MATLIDRLRIAFDTHPGRNDPVGDQLDPVRRPAAVAVKAVNWLVLGLVIVVATLAIWPVASLIGPTPGLALSWRAALHQASVLDLGYGSDLIFTYGPLGYLVVPKYFDAHTGTMAIAATALLSIGFAATAAWVIRSRVPLAVTVVAVLVAARLGAIIDPTIGSVMIVVAWASYLADRGLPFPMTTLALIGASAFGAVMVLVKFNAGVSILAVVGAITIAVAPRRPWFIAVAVLATAISLIGTWFFIGQDPADLPAFLIASWDLASGYSAAMALPLPEWQLVGAVVVLGWLLLSVAASSRHLERSTRVGMILAIAAVSFFAWKHGVVRQGLDGYFAEVVLISLLAIDWRRVDRRMAPLVLAVPLVFFLLSSPRPAVLLEAGRSIDTAKGQIATALTPGAADQTALRVQLGLRSRYALPPAIRSSISGQTTHIDGWETAIAVAYPEMEWHPAPVFQSYAVVTKSLDERNATFLRAEDRPERILRQRPRSIDGRYPLFDGPETTMTMMCSYHQVAATMWWQVVARGPDRCGPERVISVVQASEGETVSVPPIDAPSMMIGVRISGVGTGITDTVVSALYRGPIWHVVLNDRRYRLVPGTASGPLLLGTNASLGYNEGYGVLRTVRQIAVEQDGGGGPSDLTYTFFRVPVAP